MKRKLNYNLPSKSNSKLNLASLLEKQIILNKIIAAENEATAKHIENQKSSIADAKLIQEKIRSEKNQKNKQIEIINDLKRQFEAHQESTRQHIANQNKSQSEVKRLQKKIDDVEKWINERVDYLKAIIGYKSSADLDKIEVQQSEDLKALHSILQARENEL